MTHEQHAGSAAAGETVIAVVPNATLMKGFLGTGSRLHALVITAKRVLFARTTTQMLKAITAEARDAAKAEGKGFFGQWGAQMGAQGILAARYFDMSPDDILAEHPANFAIERDSIVKARLKIGAAGDQNMAASTDQLIIKTTGKKYKVQLGSGAKQAREALIEAEMI